ncbi:hypothetical protein [Mesobacillus selenatarsenatis]|uniref:hypothetical protein n=1 Tax=Mesobacillus selenatarsenatis TaxID=388741 RepID=UPI0012EC496D|nr:hypothetical protein [Mesobacillus selenatarsenatis]
MKSFFDFIGRTKATRGARRWSWTNRKAQAPWSDPTIAGAGHYSSCTKLILQNTKRGSFDSCPFR